jgi:Ca2+-binding RTX toxin-like protein
MPPPGPKTFTVLAAIVCGVIALAGAPGAAAAPKSSPRCGKIERGTRAGERLIGTRSDDLLRGRGGRDRMYGLSSADCLRGGGGGDTIKGGPGEDGIDGGAGPDHINTRDGLRDVVHCGGGQDLAKVDTLDVTRGCERVLGGAERTEAGSCSLDPATFAAVGCRQLSSDTGATTDPTEAWGRVDCASASREQLISGGGDPHATALGQAQANDAFRRLTVIDGDDYYGERCELGRNEWRYGAHGGNGTFALYQEGDRRITFASFRFGSSFPFMTSNWQTVLQMKQAQPSNNGGDGPILEIQERGGRLWLESPTTDYFSAPVTAGAWERIALDVTYSEDPSRGSLTMYIDLNGDGDVADPGEASPTIHTATLKPETSGPLTDIAPGSPIPSHLRVGIYHDPAIPCPSGCAVDVDNVQVVG